MFHFAGLSLSSFDASAARKKNTMSAYVQKSDGAEISIQLKYLH